MRSWQHFQAERPALGIMPAQQRRGRQGPSPRGYVFFMLGVLAVVGWAYALLGSEMFSINRVEAQGLKALEEGRIQRETLDILDRRGAWRPWSPRHAWFIDATRLEKDLKDRLFAQKVTVDNMDNNVLRLSIEERGSRAVFFSGSIFYWVDLDGTLVGELSPSERRSMQDRLVGRRSPLTSDPPLIRFNHEETLGIGSLVAPEARIKSAVATASELVSAGIAYRSIQWAATPTSSLQTIIGPEGYPVLMDAETDIAGQIQRYVAYRKSEPQTSSVQEYVDVRIPGMIYVK